MHDVQWLYLRFNLSRHITMLRNRIFLSLLALILVVFMTLVVVGNVTVAHTNPEITHTVNWNNTQTQDLAQRACFDCHGNETKWPWYSYIAPAASLVVKDVEEGRRKMNFSTGRELEGE